MKKVLFATTALIATAGVAAADVKFSGYGRFGAIYAENPGTTTVTPATAATIQAGPDGVFGVNPATGVNDDVLVPGTPAVVTRNPETRIESRFRMSIDASTEADNGLTFGARVRMQADDTTSGAAGAAGLNGPRFYAMAGGLTVAVGNILGALDTATPNIYTGSIGLSGLGFNNTLQGAGATVDAYTSTGTGRNGVEVIYDGGTFGAHLSHSDTFGIERLAGSMSFTYMDYTIVVGGQDSSVRGDLEYLVSVGGDMGPASFTVGYAGDNDGSGNANIAADIEVSAVTSIQAYYAWDESQVDENSYGIGFKQDLGGGASLRGGVTDNHGNTAADFGVLFNF